MKQLGLLNGGREVGSGRKVGLGALSEDEEVEFEEEMENSGQCGVNFARIRSWQLVLEVMVSTFMVEGSRI